jgi:putative peptidoglycan lipid II flippase
MSGAALGKALGFLRELEIARLLGAGIVTDSYRGALSATLLPMLPMLGDLVPSAIINLHRQWQQEDRAPRMQGALCAVFLLIGILTAVLLTVFAAPWIGMMLSGFTGETRALTVRFLCVMALVAPASLALACLSATELSLGRTRIIVLRAAAQNVGVIVGISVLAMTGDVLAPAWGFVLGNYAIMLYGGTRLWLEGEISFTGVHPASMLEAGRVFFRNARPLMAIPIAEQVQQFVERLLASRLPSGTLASVDYARTLSETAQYLISLPLGSAILARDNTERAPIRQRVDAIVAPLLALMLPATVFLALFAPDLVRAIFARGAFDEAAVATTAAALRGIAGGLWAATLGWVLLSMVTAEGRSRAALLVMLLGYGTSILVNFVAAPALGPLGIGLAEAARGLAILGGAAAVLGCLDLLGRRLLFALVPVAMLALLGFGLLDYVESSLYRLASGMLLFGFGAVIWLAVALPQMRRSLWMRLLGRGAAGAGSPERPGFGELR